MVCNASAILANAQAGVEYIAEGVTGEVEAEERQGDGTSGENAGPGVIYDDGALFAEDDAPGGVPRDLLRDDEGERCLSEDHRAQPDGKDDDNRGGDIGQDVVEHNAAVGGPKHASRLHIGLLPGREDDAAHNA